jgi:hypothetical protein
MPMIYKFSTIILFPFKGIIIFPLKFHLFSSLREIFLKPIAFPQDSVLANYFAIPPELILQGEILSAACQTHSPPGGGRRGGGCDCCKDFSSGRKLREKKCNQELKWHCEEFSKDADL